MRHQGKALADQGHELAQVNLGAMYDAGQGVSENPAKAFELFIAAADPTGFGEGQTYLITLTEGGTGSGGDDPLTDEDAERLRNAILERVKKDVGGVLRD